MGGRGKERRKRREGTVREEGRVIKRGRDDGIERESWREEREG